MWFSKITNLTAKLQDGLNLRLEHTHCYSNHNEAGHLHYDVTPETVQFEGYFSLAEKVCRIDNI